MLARLRRLLAGADPVFDDRWRDLLTREFEHWSTLTDDELERMERLVAAFVRG
jgi:hypothetical protein